MIESLVLLLLLVALRAARLHAAVAPGTRLWRRDHGWWSIELTRIVALVRAPGDSQPYPHPRETRVRLWRVFGVPVWQDLDALALPDSAAADLAAVPVSLFDAQFGPGFGAEATAAPNTYR